MPLSRRFLSMTPFTVLVPEELWLAIDKYRDESGIELTIAYEEAVNSYIAVNHGLLLADLRSAGHGGVRKTIWLPLPLGDAVRASGRRSRASYSSIILTALYARFLP